MAAVVKVSDLRKTYGFRRSNRVKALAGVDLEVGEGEIFGLLGPNGAGKTTMVKVLLGIIRSSGGEAFLLGKPAGTVSVRSRVGFLPEGHRFPSYLKGGQVLEYYGRLSGCSLTDIRPRADELLEKLSMTKWAGTKVRTYSKGMLQRLGLVQALINDPDVLFLDEPTDGVDPVGRRDIRDMLIELKKRGKTLFINSHLLMEVEMVCDRVAILHRGRVLRTGTVEELTPSSLRYRFLIEPELSAEHEAELNQGTGAVQRMTGGFTVELKEKDETGLVLRKLLDCGYRIDSMTPERVTLEDAFIDLIGKQEKEEGEAA